MPQLKLYYIDFREQQMQYDVGTIHILKRSKTLLKTVNGRGRYAKTGWTTVSLLWTYIMHVQRKMKAQYNIAIVGLVQSYIAQLAPIGGYEQLRVMLNRRNGPPDIQLSMIRSLVPVG